MALLDVALLRCEHQLSSAACGSRELRGAVEDGVWSRVEEEVDESCTDETAYDVCYPDAVEPVAYKGREQHIVSFVREERVRRCKAMMLTSSRSCADS